MKIFKAVLPSFIILLLGANVSALYAQALPTSFSWTSTGPIISPKSDSTHNIIAVKDPSIVRYNGQYVVYASTANSAGNWGMEYLGFTDWSTAGAATPYFMDKTTGFTGYHTAPQVFYFAPQNKWYLIFQSGQPQYSTNSDPTQPQNWTVPKNFFASQPSNVSNWIDFWIVCDSTNAYLFFCGDNGNFYRSSTSLANFPSGFNTPVIVYSESNANNLFEADNVYTVEGTNSYLADIECIGSDGHRFFRALTATSLGGTWTPLGNTANLNTPFLGAKNVTFNAGVGTWTQDLSSGGAVIDGDDQTDSINLNNLTFLYQGDKPNNGASSYALIPWQLGLATSKANTTISPTPTKTNTPPPPTNTPTKTNTPVPPTATFTLTRTSTPVPPTATFTRTNTPVPPTAILTFTATKTNTPVPPTATFTAVPPTATSTFTFTATKTNTPVPPTSTFTSVPPTSTFTVVPPTATRTNTPVPPTATNTNSPVPPTVTNTPVPPTATFTFTVVSPTATNTPVPPTSTFTSVPPTATDSMTPAASLTATPSASPTRTNSPVPPTATFTFTVVPPTATNTLVPPTSTFTSVPPTSTFTVVPPTATRTNTPVPPTATNTNSPVPPTVTNTPVPPTATNTSVPPTATNTLVPPTATFTLVPTATNTPTAVVASNSFKVQLLSGVTSDTTNSPHPQIQVVNTGTGPLSLNNVTVKYWFNCDCTNQTLQAWVDWAGLMPAGINETGNVHATVQATSLGGQTDFVLYSFTGNLVLQPGQAIQVQSRFNKSDWSNMTQSNDWSFAANTGFADSPKVTGYMNGSLSWGQEPAGSAAVLTVVSALAFPNPSTGNGTTLSFNLAGTSGGAASQVDPNAKVTLSIYSLSLRLIWSQTLTGGSYGTAGKHEIYWTERDLSGAKLSNGVYYLRVTVVSNGQTSSTLAKILILQ